MKRVLRWAGNIVFAVVLVLATILLVYALQARRLPDLQPWQSDPPTLELTAREMGDSFTLADYLRREDEVFAETRRTITASIPPSQQTAGNRYWPGSRNSQWNFRTDWNRTFDMVPAQVRGGALLLHGLTDSPYSMRTMARALNARGYYVLVLRMPGHGTVPAALTTAQWQDWMAATRVGARAVRARIGPKQAFVIVGYSNGAALAVKHQLDALDDAALPRADRIVLLSPMIGISRAAAMSRFLNRLSFIPFFRKSAWTDIQPEYNPFKYNSFPLNAARQTHALTGEIADAMARLKANGRLARMPPILAFQSVLDSTVSTAAVVHTLFDNLPANGSELVLFDVNRAAVLQSLVTPSDRALLGTLTSHGPHGYRLTVVGNADGDPRMAVARSTSPGGHAVETRPTGLEYPADVFSLSHVAMPFRCDDPLYGLHPDRSEDLGIRLGNVALHGERGTLVVSVDQLARLGCDPFYPYMEQHVEEWIGAVPVSAAPR